MQHKFKIVPFIISLIILIGGTLGISLYAYNGYEPNHYEYLMDYLHYTDYATIPDSLESQVERYAKLKSNYYSIITDDLAYYDIKKANKSGIEAATYSETASKFSAGFGIDGVTYKNGVLHVGEGDDHYFDLMLILEATYSEDMTQWGYNYYFAVFNINYDKIYSTDSLYLLFVNGDKYSEDDELYGTEKLVTVLDEFKGGDSTVLYNTATSFSLNYNNNTFNLYDTGATKGGKKVENKMVTRLYTLTSSKSNASDKDDEDAANKYFHEFNNVSFSILTTGKSAVSDNYNAEESGYEEIVRGNLHVDYPNYPEKKVSEDGEVTYTTHKGVNDFVKAYGTDDAIFEGQAISLDSGMLNINFKKTTYGKYMVPQMILVIVISIIVFGVLAALFYFIWQADPDQTQVKVVKAKKKKVTKK